MTTSTNNTTEEPTSESSVSSKLTEFGERGTTAKDTAKKARAVSKSRVRLPQKSFQGSKANGPIFQYFMTGDDYSSPDTAGVTTPTKRRHSPLGSLSDYGAGSFEGNELPDQSPRKLTICEAIDEKFSHVNYNASRFCPVDLSPVKFEKDGSVRVPWTLVLEGRKIGYAGDCESLSKYCGNVRELDLSHNDLQSWNEVVTILNEMPHLTELMLGHNKRLCHNVDFTSSSSMSQSKGQKQQHSMNGIRSMSSPEEELVNCNSTNASNNGETASGEEQVVQASASIPMSSSHLNGRGGWDSFTVHPNLKTLVLINTGTTMQTIVNLLPKLPSLQELHLSLNGYEEIEDRVMETAQPHVNVHTLYFTDNQLKHWTDFRKLAQLFPHLRYLFLAHNHLTHIDISLEGIFPDLESLHIAGNRMNSWECLDRLNDLPALTSLRMYNIPYYDDSAPDPAIRRLLCIARLKHVTTLNGSLVTSDNRVDAERYLIRHYLDTDHTAKPQRYHDLVNKYGQLGKLVEVDLSPVEQITLMFHCSDMDIFPREIKVKPSMTVLQLKTQVSEIIGLAVKDFELFYKDALVAEKFGHDSSFTHLKLMSIQLSTISGLTDQTELHARVTVQHLIRQGVKLKTTSKQN